MSEKKVLILLSAYNGESFIGEQLDSLLNQKHIRIHILVRDDGSSDKTCEIIQDYISRNTETIELINGENIGWRKSFFTLVNEAYNRKENYDYFAFCDQDDIWLEEKLHTAVTALDRIDNPIKLYCSNLYHYENGEVRGLINRKEITPDIYNCSIRNLATGCTMVFSKNLLEPLSKTNTDFVPAHDYRTYQLALLCGGEVYIDDKSYILYRQHSNNQIGSKNGFLDRWKRRFNNFSENKHLREHTAIDMMQHYGDYLTDEAKCSLRRIANYNSNLFSKITLLKDRRYTTGRAMNDLWLKLRVLIGIF